MNKVYIIVLNYNRWQDTIECLESVLRNDYTNYQVIVIDNDSSNNSMKYIKDWAEGKLDIWINPKHPLKDLSFPPIKKPIPYVYYTREEAEKGGNPKLENTLKYKLPDNITTKEPLILIQSEKNKGYAAGNNIGIKYALKKNDFEYIWILNNDTVIRKDSLSKLISCMENKGKEYGMFGTVLLYYDKPNLVQALGGKFSKLFSTGKHLYANRHLNEVLSKNIKFDYIIGASLVLRKEFLLKVGMLSEDYFIYYEEIDLAFRAKKKNYKMFICKNSIVFHKESVTIKEKEKKINSFSDYYRIRNRIKISKKYNRIYLPFLYIGLFISFLKRIKRRQYKLALNIIKIIFEENKKEKNEENKK